MVMEQWSRLYFSDISRYCSSVLGKTDLINRLECEYKQGKAYRYFTNKFIGEISFHDVSGKSQFCILKTKCVPSQRVLIKQYGVWVICRKNKGEFIGGEILAGYCMKLHHERAQSELFLWRITFLSDWKYFVIPVFKDLLPNLIEFFLKHVLFW